MYKWLNSFYTKELMKGKYKIISAPSPKQIKEDEYLKSARKFVAPVMQNLQAMRVN